MSDKLQDLNAAATDWLQKQKDTERRHVGLGTSATIGLTPAVRLQNRLEKELPIRRVVSAEARRDFLDWLKWVREQQTAEPCDDTDLWLIETVEEVLL